LQAEEDLSAPRHGDWSAPHVPSQKLGPHDERREREKGGEQQPAAATEEINAVRGD
jgi:hypothetical protein